MTVTGAAMEEIDVHILVVPTMSWQSDLRISYSSACVEAVSAGFIRLLPSSILAELRATARDQLNRYTLPPHFVFLRRLGRCLTQVSVKQEKLLQIGSFLQKGASFIEIFIIDTASIGRSMNRNSGEHHRATTLTHQGQEMEQRKGYDSTTIEPTHLGEQWKGCERHTEADYDQREWLHPTAGNPGDGQQARKTAPTNNLEHITTAGAGTTINYHAASESDSSLDSSSEMPSSNASSQHERSREVLDYTSSTDEEAPPTHTLTHNDYHSKSSHRQLNVSQQTPMVQNVTLNTDKPPPASSSSMPDNIGQSTLADNIRVGILQLENNGQSPQADKNESSILVDNNGCNELDENSKQLQTVPSETAQDEAEVAELLAQIQLVQDECDQLNTTKKLLEERQKQSRAEEQWRKKYHKERQKTIQLRSQLAVAKRQATKDNLVVPSGQEPASGSSSEHANMIAQCGWVESDIELLRQRLHHTRHQLSIEQQAQHSKLSERHQLQQELVSKKIAATAARARH